MSAQVERPQLRVVGGAVHGGISGDEDTAHDVARITGTPSGERVAGEADVAFPVDEPPVCREGEQYGAVVVRRFVTRGGMGEVYEAYHPHMDQRVALKVLRKQFRERPDFVERFRDEGRILASICQKEPNVVQIRDVGFDPRCGPFITMEWLVGKNFAELIDAWGGSIPVAQAVHLAIRVANVTHQVHLLGLIHRDLKPANLFLERVPGADPRLVLLDLGISKRIGGERTTDENRTLGTIDYMAPEQITTGRATVQSDVYALAFILYEMLAGDHPFGDAAREAEASGGADQRHLVMMGGHLYGTIRPLPRNVAPDAEAPAGTMSLSAILARAMSREPEARPATMEAFAADLRAWHAAHRAPARRPEEPRAIEGLKDAVESATPPPGPGPHGASARRTARVEVPAAPAAMVPEVRRAPIEKVEMSAMVSGCSLLVGWRGHTGDRYPLLGSVTRIGREAGENDLVIDHPTVSRTHCELRHVVPGVFQVVDLGSTHGLVIDDLPARAGILRPGQQLRLGDVLLGLVSSGGWITKPDGRTVFVFSAMDLSPSERATVRMVGDASAPLGKILEAHGAIRRREAEPAAAEPGPARGPLSARSSRLAPLRRLLYIVTLVALAVVAGLAVLRLLDPARTDPHAKEPGR